jgi:hypothetical protein
MKHLQQLGSAKNLKPVLRDTSIPINSSVNDTGKGRRKKKYDPYMDQKSSYHGSKNLNYLQVMEGANILSNNSHGANAHFQRTENIQKIYHENTEYYSVKSRERKCGHSERVLIHKNLKNPKDTANEKLVLQKKLNSESKVSHLVYDVKESWHNKTTVRSGAPKDGKGMDLIMFKEKLAKIKSNFFGEPNH